MLRPISAQTPALPTHEMHGHHRRALLARWRALTAHPSMKKFGLALSGGGFRATLYHLGLIRFFRDAGLLSNVTHITSVSGGSIMAAHLVLHWQRYTGTETEFDQAAAELLSFVQLDIRNRILRRFPLTI